MSYQLIHSDIIDTDAPLSSVKLVYLDPPYGPESMDTYYGVGRNIDEFIDYLKQRLLRVKEFLAFDANVLVHVDDKLSHYIKVMMDEVFGFNNFRNEIIWCFSSPSAAKRHLPRKHQVILWYGLGDYPFNPERIPHRRLHVGGNKSWAQKRITQAQLDEYLRRGKPLFDWWDDIPYLCRNEEEKCGYPTQKPLALLKRIVKMFSNTGDIVVDPFMGSGTTVLAAHLCERHGVGFDISEDALKEANRRLGHPIDDEVEEVEAQTIDDLDLFSLG
jgi:DNA modification methylase